MASRYWGINRGQLDTSVVEQSTLPTKDVIVILDLSKNLTREDLLIQLERIRIKMLEDAWPPA